MPKAVADGIHIEYETLGDRAGRPLLLIGGLANQLINWDDDLCEDLAKRGHYVIRFDNRDAGLSTKWNETERPARHIGGLAYTLDDMADDAKGLLDALKIGKAHICGTSMGGMIAQTLAIRHPSRVLSLISIYSTSGNRHLPPPKPEVMGVPPSLPLPWNGTRISSIWCYCRERWQEGGLPLTKHGQG